MVSTNASPRPMAPAGGATSSLFSMAASNSATSRGSIRWPKGASTTTVSTSPAGPGRRPPDLVVLDGGVELGPLPRVDPMAEGGIHDNGDHVVWVLLHEREDGLVELLEARQRSPFGGEVRAVDHDVSWHTGLSVNHLDAANDGIAAPGRLRPSMAQG